MSIDSTEAQSTASGSRNIPGLQLQGASVQALQSTSSASHCQRESTARPSQTKPEAREQQYHGANFATTFAMVQPEHCTPAQHKPKILNNELSNNNPSCLRSILASASSMQLKDSKRNSAATTPRQLKPQNRGTGTRSRRSRGHLGRAAGSGNWNP